MSHIYFCCNSNCPNGKNIHAMKCGGCETSWYCGETCQKADWPNHKFECRDVARIHLEKELFHIVAKTQDRDTDAYPFEHFQGFMKHQSYLYTPRTTQEWMEDWLSGWYTESRERKDMLRTLFHTNGMKWSLDAYVLYLRWSEIRNGNRYQKMKEFVKLSKSLF